MLFTYCPDNPESAAHQLQLFGGIFTRNSAHHHIPGSMTLPAAVFRHGEVIQERFAGTGLPQRALHGRVIHPAGKGIAFFLQLLKVGFHLRDTAGDFSERLPKFIRRSLSSCACR